MGWFDLNSNVVILGVPVDSITMAETVDRLDDFIQVGRQNGKAHQVATVNVDFIVNARRDPELLYMLQNVSLALPDGMPLVWGARRLGAPVAERVAGVDVVLQLAGRAAQKNYAIYLLGATPEVASRAAEILVEKHPGLNIVGVSSPMIPSIEDTPPEILAEIRRLRPDILLVAFGNPKQEKWIARYGMQLHVPVMIGVGGTLDFISGIKKRAPQWMQRSGLEWTHRLAQEPGRLWRRYTRDIFVFGRLFLQQWWRMRPAGPQTGSLSSRKQADSLVISAAGCLSLENTPALSALALQAIQTAPRVAIDLSQVTRIDASALGALVDLTRQARDRGGELVLINIPASIQETLNFLQMDRFFHLPLDHGRGPDPVVEPTRPELG